MSGVPEPRLGADGEAALWEDLIAAIDEETGPQKRCRAICRRIGRGFGFPRVLLSTLDRERGLLVVRGAHDPSATGPLYRVLSDLWAATLEPAADGRLNVSAWCVEKKEQVYVPDATRYDFRPEATYQRNRVARALGVKGYVLTPILSGTEAIGLLGVEVRAGEEVSAEQRRMQRAVAGFLGVAMPRILRPSAEPEVGEDRESPPSSLPEGAPMRPLLDILDQGILVVGADDRIRYLNHAATRLLDVPPWEAVGRRWFEVLVLKRPADFAELLGAAGSGGKGPVESGTRRWTVVRPNAAEIDVELKLLPLSSTVMAGARAIVMEDVSQRIRLQRVRDEFVSMLVHDLKAPLQSIVGFAELLRIGRLGAMNEDQKDFVGRIERSGEQMMRLIEDILEVARYETGRSLMTKERVPSSPLVEAIVQGIQGMALPARVEIRNDVSPDLPDLYADPLRLTQVFQNVLANAIDLSPEDGVVWVRGSEVRLHGEPYVRFEIADEGPGFADEEHEHLFEKFWSGGAGGNGHLSHGLGLVIARLIVEGHRGEISARRRDQGGTAFSFAIPVHRPRSLSE